MIKVTENKLETKQVEVKYPCLMKSNAKDSKDLIVLMTSNTIGMVVNSGESIHSIGNYSQNWAMICFEPIDYPITLENEF